MALTPRERQARHRERYYVQRFCLGCRVQIDKTGGRVRCKECDLVVKAERARNKRRINKTGPNRCVDCNIDLSAYFGNKKRCKECIRIKNRKTRQEKFRKNPELKRKHQIQTNEWIKNKLKTDPEWRKKRKISGSAWKHNISAKQVFDMLEKQKGECVYCKKDIRKCYQMDHIYPQSKGGPSTIDNLQLVCKKCNSSKGNRDPEEFAESLI